MLNKEILGQCENVIRNELGHLDDIPYELANSIVNVYYKYFSIGNELMKNKIPTNGDNTKNIFNGLKAFSKEFHTLQFKIEFIPKIINQLREFDKNKFENMYKN